MSAALDAACHRLSQPESVLWLRRALVALFVIWLVFSAARLFWSFFPSESAASAKTGSIVNPVSESTGGATRPQVDIEALRGRHLFGEAAAVDQVEAVVAPPVQSSRDGIEKDARETRLQLVLRGVVASSEDGLGHAIIEYRKKQAVYAVEDELPVSGKVVLAKVMPQQVVLDNGGTYELLTLFEENELGVAAPARPATPVRTDTRRPGNRGAPKVVDKRNEQAATELATGYRNRLYENPQSLADVVSVSAVREEGRLRGYRVAPGKDREQFSRLGFKAGDLVTSVNGITLDDPSNTMRLYQTMRSATEAVFDLQRDGQTVSISVTLGAEG